MKARWDAVVVGAGPAGTAAAVALAQGGASVLVVERAPFPRWKVCGACLGPSALASLDALGAGDLPRRLGAAPLAEMLLHTRGTTARLRLEGWTALSRAALDLALLREAERAGVTVWSPARATLGPVAGGARSLRVKAEGAGTDVGAGVVIDATGLGQGLAQDGRAATRPSARARIGAGAVLEAPDYPVAPGELHMAIGASGYVGLVRVEDGSLNVAAALDAGSLRAERPARVAASILAAAGFPPLPVETRHAWRGTPALTRSAEDVGADRLLRVGDAAGYVEPFTGEGIGWALADGRAAAAAALGALGRSFAAALEEWRRYRVARRADRERLCRALARGLRHPWMVSLAVSAVRAAPVLAGPFVRRAARRPRATPGRG